MSEDRFARLRGLVKSNPNISRSNDEDLFDESLNEKELVQKRKFTGSERVDNKVLLERSSYYDLEHQIYDLKLDIITLFHLLQNKPVRGKKLLERKDIESLYMDFKKSKDHLVKRLK